MFVSLTELRNNLEKYIDLAAEQEVVITRNGQPIARLVAAFQSDCLIGVLPPNADEKAAKEERLSNQ